VNTINQKVKKTTLAVLRSMLTYGVKEKIVRFSKAEADSMEKRGVKVKWAEDSSYAYGPKKVAARLTAQTVADWLGCSKQNVTDIECAKVLRKKLKNGRVKKFVRRLTPEQAEILQLKTGCTAAWLLGTKTTPPAWFSQKTFERAQSLGYPPTGGPSLLQLALKETLPLLANVLLNALDCDEVFIYKTKTRRALENILNQMPQKPRTDLYRFVDFSSTNHKTPDYKPLFDEFQKQALKICDRELKAWEIAEGIRPSRP